MIFFFFFFPLFRKENNVFLIFFKKKYMAPEVIRGARYDEKVDVWSYGVLVWEMLTGNVPYEGLHQNSILFGVGREPPILTVLF